jgi:hypothetical protein
MRLTKVLGLGAVALGIALTGCDSNGTTTGSPSSSAGATTGTSASAGATSTASSATGTGSAAQCLVGTWKATSLSGQLSAAGSSGSVEGGAGANLVIGADGKTTVDFTGMKPVNFTGDVAGNTIKGSFFYGGKVLGTVKTASGNSGTFEPVGTVDWNALKVTVEIASPPVGRIADNLPIAQFAGSGSAQTGTAVEAQPILKRAQYTLTLAPPAGQPNVGTWTLQKA